MNRKNRTKQEIVFIHSFIQRKFGIQILCVHSVNFNTQEFPMSTINCLKLLNENLKRKSKKMTKIQQKSMKNETTFHSAYIQ